MAALADRMRHGMVVMIGVAAAIAMQFVVFQVEYHGEYRLRSAVWLNGNLRGAMLRLIEEHDRRPGSKIYFATFRNGQGHWDLKNRYLPPYGSSSVVKQQAAGLMAETVFMERTGDIRTIPPGSVVLDNIEDPNLRRLLESGSTRIADIPEADREPFMTIVFGDQDHPRCSSRRAGAVVAARRGHLRAQAGGDGRRLQHLGLSRRRREAARPGDARVLLLGGTRAYGYGASATDTIAHALEWELTVQTQRPHDGDRRGPHGRDRIRLRGDGRSSRRSRSRCHRAV